MTNRLQLLGLAVIAAASTASAATYNLGDLIASGDSITLGDKKWSGFEYSSAAFPDPSIATVTTSQDGNTYYLTFEGPWVTADVAGADVSLGYIVETTSGLPLIKAIDQAYRSVGTGNGGYIVIGETVRDANGDTVAQSSLDLFLDSGDVSDPDPEPDTGDDLIVDPALSKLWVSKDILFAAADDSSSVGPTWIRQSFHQIAVPDGGTTVLMLGAAVTMVGLVRRRIAA